MSKKNNLFWSIHDIYWSCYICVTIFPSITLWSFHVFISLALKANDNPQFPVGMGWRTVEGWWWKCTHLHLEERSRSRSQTERSAEKERTGDLDRKWNQQRHRQRSVCWDQRMHLVLGNKIQNLTEVESTWGTKPLLCFSFAFYAEIWRTTISCASTVSFSCLIKAHLKNC